MSKLVSNVNNFGNIFLRQFCYNINQNAMLLLGINLFFNRHERTKGLYFLELARNSNDTQLKYNLAIAILSVKQLETREIGISIVQRLITMPD